VIAPACPADFDIGGAVKLAELIEGQLRAVRPGLRLLGVLICQVDRRWTLAHDTRAALEEAGIGKLVTEIPFRVRVGAAPRHAGLSGQVCVVLVMRPWCRVAVAPESRSP
jgi:cellulose biosynthesis protein BcsQ